MDMHERRMKEPYCTSCGSKKVPATRNLGYNPQTGEPLNKDVLVCSNPKCFYYCYDNVGSHDWKSTFWSSSYRCLRCGYTTYGGD